MFRIVRQHPRVRLDAAAAAARQAQDTGRGSELGQARGAGGACRPDLTMHRRASSFQVATTVVMRQAEALLLEYGADPAARAPTKEEKAAEDAWCEAELNEDRSQIKALLHCCGM